MQDYEKHSLVSNEVKANRLKSLAKLYFQDFVKFNYDIDDYKKISAQLNSFMLPSEYKEFFIRINNLGYIFICNHPILTTIEEKAFAKLDPKLAHLDNFKQTKEYFYKWNVTKNDQERKHFATQVVNLVEKNTNKENFVKFFYSAVIFLLDPSLKNLNFAIEAIENALTHIDNSTFENFYKNEANYLANVLYGFLYLVTQDFDNAAKKFSFALNYIPTGINAKYYLAICNIHQNMYQNAINLLNEIMHFDLERIEYALANNNLPFYAFSVANAYFHHVFINIDFFPIIDDIDAMFRNNIELLTTSFEKLTYKCHKILNCGVDEFISPKSRIDIEFIQKVVQTFADSKNTYIVLSAKYLDKKFRETLDNIINAITTKYETMMEEQLATYDNQKAMTRERIEKLQSTLEELKNNLKEKYEEGIKIIEKNTQDNISIIEKKIQQLENSKKFDPQSNFNTSILYNILFSSFIFLISGFASCSSSTETTDAPLKIFLISGFKWGIVTFILGFIIAAISSAYAVVDKQKEKQKYLKKITAIKNRHDKEIEHLKREYEARVKAFEDDYGQRIKDFEDKITKLTEDKIKETDFFKQEAQRRINEQIDKFREIINL
ncbi:MAG TPA: hypothetical protein PK887_10210 [Ignavibacteriales bacterium]|nr:hypothetical protein [Ignavibacteriales bacterium]